jgi:iron complex outermembrane recepter protein
MQEKTKRLSKSGAWILFAANASLSFAQSPSAPDISAAATSEDGAVVKLGEVVVAGKRASLATAQEIKRDKVEIVDSVAAEDINKLPDFNVTDALSRITGVQVARDRGEGAGVAVRGLTQVETTLNGRETFTAGTGRNLNFADIPAEMLAGIDVYKTPSAEQIEGGVGGSIDLRTRRPFDFKSQEFAGSARMIHGELVDKTEPQASLLASNRWKTPDLGEFGALVNLSYQKRAFREDQKSSGNPQSRTGLVPGQTVTVPTGTTETISLGSRERTAANLVLQWRPSQALELYAEGSYSEFRTLQDSYQTNVSASPTFVAGSPTLFPGTRDLKGITWTNAPISVLSFARDTVDRTSQAAVGGVWTGKEITLKTDVSYTKSYNSLFFSGLNLGSMAANFTQDQSGSVPGTNVAGTNLLDPANFKVASVLYRSLPYEGDLSTARLDGEYAFGGGFLDTLSAGVRYARRGADNASGLIFADANAGNIPATAMPSYVMANPYGNFFPGTASVGSTLAGNLASARDASGLRNAFGITAPVPAANPLGAWRIQEETQAGYLMARFNALNMALDGNAGVRVVRTHEAVSGNQSVPTTGAVAPIDIGSSDTDTLPSMNLRYELKEGLYLRGAASKTVTRPDFSQLSPSLVLNRNTVNPALNQGSSGNPALKPVRSNNLDVALERYFNPATSIYLTGFTKKVDGFVTTVSDTETHDGEAYLVSRPQNANTADIKGIEAGYQQFYDFLPGWLGGLGLQANYTYVDSETLDSTLGKVPLQNLSKNSANLAGMYEKGRVSARLAYNWRDKFLSGVTNVVGVGALPIYTKAYGWLDASLIYRYSDKMSFTIEGLNLLRTVRSSYYGVETRPQSAWANDLQVSASVTARF